VREGWPHQQVEENGVCCLLASMPGTTTLKARLAAELRRLLEQWREPERSVENSEKIMQQIVETRLDMLGSHDNLTSQTVAVEFFKNNSEVALCSIKDRPPAARGSQRGRSCCGIAIFFGRRRVCNP
jgi:hypothetical protein